MRHRLSLVPTSGVPEPSACTCQTPHRIPAKLLDRALAAAKILRQLLTIVSEDRLQLVKLAPEINDHIFQLKTSPFRLTSLFIVSSTLS